MDFDPDLERRRKDFCQFKRCKSFSDIIFKGKGYCDTHFPNILGIQAIDSCPHDALACGCSDCIPEGNYSQEVVVSEPIYASIDAYTKATGKRFRMTKAQKERGLNRDQAFKETYDNQIS